MQLKIGEIKATRAFYLGKLCIARILVYESYGIHHQPLKQAYSKTYWLSIPGVEHRQQFEAEAFAEELLKSLVGVGFHLLTVQTSTEGEVLPIDINQTQAAAYDPFPPK